MNNGLTWWRSIRRHPRLDLFISGAEFIVLTGLYLIFIVKDRVPPAGWALLAIVWLFRWGMIGRLTVATPLDMPILGILLMLGLSLWVSTDWSLSLPKVYGSVLGIGIYYAVVNAVTNLRRVKVGVDLLVLLAAGVALVGVIGTDWVNSKVFTIPFIYNHLPRLISGVTRSADGGFQHNIVGGTLIYFIPLLVSLIWGGRKLDLSGVSTRDWLQKVIRKVQLPILIVSLLIVLFTLILTQSRGSFLGVGAALLVLAAWYDRRFLWGFPVLAVAALVLVRILGAANLVELLTSMDSFSGGHTFSIRMQIWQRAALLIRDFPFTGIGIGTFYPVTQALYPFFDVSRLIPHAHNIILTTAVDLGIPGLLLYSALLSGFAFSAWKAYRALDRSMRVIIVGLACGMLAHLLYGAMDSFELGTKSGAVLWIFLGLAAALYVNRQSMVPQAMPASSSTESNDVRLPGSMPWISKIPVFILALFLWVLLFLFAIAFVEIQTYIGLALAVLGGIGLGFILTGMFKSKSPLKVP